MLCSIGEFHKVDYQRVLNKYAYHRMLLCLLGKNECKNLSIEELLAENNDVMKECYYDEALKS